MGRTWLLRGTAAAVFAVLLGAWAVGVSGLRDSDSPSEERPPATPGSSTAPEDERSVVRGNGKPLRPRTTDRPRDEVRKPRPDTDDPTPSDSPGTPPPRSPDPTPDAPAPTEDPPKSPEPPGPSDPPDTPTDDCTDLPSAIDCLLDPVTGQP